MPLALRPLALALRRWASDHRVASAPCRHGGVELQMGPTPRRRRGCEVPLKRPVRTPGPASESCQRLSRRPSGSLSEPPARRRHGVAHADDASGMQRAVDAPPCSRVSDEAPRVFYIYIEDNCRLIRRVSKQPLWRLPARRSRAVWVLAPSLELLPAAVDEFAQDSH